MSIEIRSFDSKPDLLHFSGMQTTGTAVLFLHPRIALTAKHVIYKGTFRRSGGVYVRPPKPKEGEKPVPGTFISFDDGVMPEHPELDLRMVVLREEVPKGTAFLTREEESPLERRILMQGFGGPDNPQRDNRELKAKVLIDSGLTFSASTLERGPGQSAYSGDSGSPAFLDLYDGKPPTKCLGVLSLEMTTGVDRLVFTRFTEFVEDWVVESALKFGIKIPS